MDQSRRVSEGPGTYPPEATTARGFVTTWVTTRARRFPDLEPAPLATEGLDQRDTALARAIARAVAQRWLTLATVIQSQLNRPWEKLEPAVQGALLVGAAQLLVLGRLPDHAVIYEAVAWIKAAKGQAGPGAGGLVNAVLRQVANLRERRLERRLPLGYERNELPLPDGGRWRLTQAVFDNDPMCRLAQQTSHPPELLKRWVGRFGCRRAQHLAVHNLLWPPIIIAGVGGGGEGAADPGHLPPGCRPHEETGFTLFEEDRAHLRQLLDDMPSARVQDPAAAAAAVATRPLAPNLIIDVCAGKGTKTRQLAELHPTARIVASDTSRLKVATLRQVFSGHHRVRVVRTGELRRFTGKADLVLLDVPCSNTGVLARRVEARYRFSPRSLKRLVELQRRIIVDSLGLLAGGGHMLYSTCSLEAEENEQQANWITRWHPMEICRAKRRWPRGLPGDPPARYCDGGYFALLKRSE